VQSILKIFSRWSGPTETPLSRTFRGLRTGDQRALLTGAALLGLRWLRSQSKERELVYSKEIPEGSAVVVRYGKRGRLPEVDVRRVERQT
jgi:hypothetical protein